MRKVTLSPRRTSTVYQTCTPPLPPNPQLPVANTVEELSTAGLSSTEFEEMLKAKVALGLKLDRGLIADNRDRLLPVDVVEARSTVKYLDDGF